MDDHAYTDDDESDQPQSPKVATQTRVDTPYEAALLAKAKKRRLISQPASSKAPMSQLTIQKCFNTSVSTWPEHTNVSVVDLFCCIGGFSTGCVAAGHKLVLAVDNDKVALDAHQENHPSCKHELMELGPDTETRLLEIMRQALPKSGDGSRFLPWHLHGSPPCQKFCTLLRTKFPTATAEERLAWIDEGMSMVTWYLQLVEKCFQTMDLVGWSFEEAPSSHITSKLTELKRSRSKWLDFELVDLWKFGIAQTRKRTIGGSPWLIDRLRHDGRLRERMTIQDVLTPPNGAVSLRSVWCADRDDSLDVLDTETGETINPNNERRIRLLHELSFTIMAGHGNMWWYDVHMNQIRKLSITERKQLQTFPSDYTLPQTSCDQAKGIGNAIPPLFAQKFMSRYRPM
jgi:DNA (cytosine-5)-methyltransferase 1